MRPPLRRRAIVEVDAMLKRLLRRSLAAAAAAVLAGAAALAGLLWFPQPLFAHVADTGLLRIHCDRPIPETAARRFAADVAARLAHSPLRLAHRRYRLFVAHDLWRRRLLWTATSPHAGGFVLYPFAPRNIYLSGADFARDTLISPSGIRVGPPRTLGYYGAHELAHIATGERVGSARFLLMPKWVREGVADHAALGRTGSFDALHRAIAAAPNDVRLWHRHGFYAKYRLLVLFFLEHEGWPLEQLLASDLTEAEATARMMEALRPSGH